MSDNVKVTFDEVEDDIVVDLDGGIIHFGNLQIGTTTTGESGSEARVTNSGTPESAILNFTIPKGEQGPQGEKGDSYIITDKDMQEVESNVKADIQPTLENIQEVAETAESIARGKSQAIVFDTFEEMEAWIKDEANKGIGLIGDNLYIKQMWIDEEETIRQPDYWIAEVLDEPNELGYYYNISDLGVEHPDLTNVVKNTDYATASKGGTVRVTNYGHGLRVIGTGTAQGTLSITEATEADIDGRSSLKPITPTNLDYAVGTVKSSENQSGTAKMWTSINEDGEIGLNISTEV